MSSEVCTPLLPLATLAGLFVGGLACPRPVHAVALATGYWVLGMIDRAVSPLHPKDVSLEYEGWLPVVLLGAVFFCFIQAPVLGGWGVGWAAMRAGER